MRYFTLERYLRLGDLSNEQAFLAAQDEWESAISAYREHLARIRRRLPRGLRELIESVYLHDAAVIDMWQEDDTRFTITLRPESARARLVVLSYSLVEPPRIDRAALPAEVRGEPAAWLYDELDVEEGGGGNGSAKKGKTLVHDILLSNGWELRLRFRTVTVSRPVALLPAGMA